jgi:hypothetical protein
LRTLGGAIAGSSVASGSSGFSVITGVSSAAPPQAVANSANATSITKSNLDLLSIFFSPEILMVFFERTPSTRNRHFRGVDVIFHHEKTYTIEEG